MGGNGGANDADDDGIQSSTTKSPTTANTTVNSSGSSSSSFDNSDTSTQLPSGSLAGIVVGILLVVVAVYGVCLCTGWCKRKDNEMRAAREEFQESDTLRNTVGMMINPLAERITAELAAQTVAASPATTTMTTSTTRTMTTTTTVTAVNPTFVGTGALPPLYAEADPNRSAVCVQKVPTKGGLHEIDDVAAGGAAWGMAVHHDFNGYVVDESLNNDPNAPIVYAVPGYVDVGYTAPLANCALPQAAPTLDADGRRAGDLNRNQNPSVLYAVPAARAPLDLDGYVVDEGAAAGAGRSVTLSDYLEPNELQPGMYDSNVYMKADPNQPGEYDRINATYAEVGDVPPAGVLDPAGYVDDHFISSHSASAGSATYAVPFEAPGQQQQQQHVQPQGRRLRSNRTAAQFNSSA